MRLHIGSGASAIPGWTNIDVAPHDGVDRVLDVREGLPFEGVKFIFAEHFLEHLTLAEGIAFLCECRRVLRADGVLRLSTPNLEWVWLTHYKPPDELTEEERLTGCLELNRAFHGWGHRFLYNFITLAAAARDAGFRDVSRKGYGESDVEALRGLERHERHADVPGATSVIVIEASGVGTASESLQARIAPYLRDASVR